jgi:hypothetical protein
MWTLKKSMLFKRQLSVFAKGYNENAGHKTAIRFIDTVEEAINFIQKKPLVCRIYYEVQKHPQLQNYEFRKWSVKGFPHTVFFRFSGDRTILLEAIFAHRMNTIKRLSDDAKS